MSRHPVNGFPVLLCSLIVAFVVSPYTECKGEDPKLIGHWPLTSDFKDRSGTSAHTRENGPTIKDGSALFDGIDDSIECSHEAFNQLGTSDFTVSLQFSTDGASNDLPGDLVSLYDPKEYRGFHVSLKTHEVTTSRTQSRTLHFGIDSNKFDGWKDEGRRGNALLIFALAVHNHQLFAGTCEAGADEHGRVFRWDGKGNWVDCQVPCKANSVSSLAVVNGELYAGTAKYRLAGSALPESTNPELGGQVYRYKADGEWEDCGQLPDTEAIGGMTLYRGKLYAGSLYRPAGFFRYEGDKRWTPLPTPNGKRVEAMCVFNGQLFASSYDEAHIYRYDGEQWTDCGQVGDETNTQTYSFAIHRGKLYVGTWRSGKVFRYDGDQKWIDCGRLGNELEVMGMLVHNGRLIAGSLPLAGVFQYRGGTVWDSLGRVDLTPDVMYRRAWTMAEFRGRMFVGTLPSGHILSASVGVNATYDAEISDGWHHVVARRAGSKLDLYLDGKLVAESVAFNPLDYDLSTSHPLRIGLGSNDYFNGRMREVRLYKGAINEAQIRELSARP